MPIRIALYQPDIPQNCGTLMRLAAALGIGIDIIEPCGFMLDDRKLKRAGMDYLAFLDRKRHANWAAFANAYADRRIVLLTTKTQCSYMDFDFRSDDILLAGSESSGVPEDVHNAIEHKVTIPMRAEARSINVATAVSMVLGKALV